MKHLQTLLTAIMKGVYLHNRYKKAVLEIQFEGQFHILKNPEVYQRILHLKNNLFAQMKYFELK